MNEPDPADFFMAEYEHYVGTGEQEIILNLNTFSEQGQDCHWYDIAIIYSEYSMATFVTGVPEEKIVLRDATSSDLGERT